MPSKIRSCKKVKLYTARRPQIILSSDVPPSTVLLNFGVFGCAVSIFSGFALSAPCIPDCGADRYLTVGIAATSVIAQVSKPIEYRMNKERVRGTRANVGSRNLSQ